VEFQWLVIGGGQTLSIAATDQPGGSYVLVGATNLVG
jgi:hypothetical protein